MKKFYLFLSFSLLFFSANSQYTYINLNAGYEGVPLVSEFSTNLTGIKSITTSATVISRFKRHIGVGGKISLVLNQNFDFSFKKGLFSGTYSDNYITDPTDRYYVQEYDYNVSYQNIFSLFGRVYFDKFLNMYSDINVSYLKINESFKLQRAYVPPLYSGYKSRPEIPAEDIDFKDSYSLISPGIRLGASPHINDYLYVDFNFGWDFLFFKRNNFQYSVPYKYDTVDDWHSYKSFISQANGTKPLFSINLGIGYYF